MTKFNKLEIDSKNQKLQEVSNIYFNEHDKFTQIAKNAHEIPTILDWKKFTDIIINNMIGEKS